jgi:hypothetical protein
MVPIGSVISHREAGLLTGAACQARGGDDPRPQKPSMRYSNTRPAWMTGPPSGMEMTRGSVGEMAVMPGCFKRVGSSVVSMGAAAG